MGMADGGMMANGGNIVKSRRFTEYDFSKLTDEDFYGILDGSYYTIKKEKDNKAVAKFYPSKERLVITKDADLMSWLKNNSYLMSFEYADGGMMAKGGKLDYDDFVKGKTYWNSLEGEVYRFTNKDESGRLHFQDLEGIDRIFSPKIMSPIALTS
jgi:hypothetical protein